MYIRRAEQLTKVLHHQRTLGCCERNKIAIVASINKIKLPFDIGFSKMEKFFKNVNVFVCLQGAKVTENKDVS